MADKMKISSEFNRFIHGVVLKEIITKNILMVDLGRSKLTFHPYKFSPETLKWFLKILDFNYPREVDGKPFSYTKLSEADTLKHLNFIEMLLIDNGYEVEFSSS